MEQGPRVTPAPPSSLGQDGPGRAEPAGAFVRGARLAGHHAVSRPRPL